MPEQVAIPARLLQESPLGQQIVAFKVWGPRGRVVYASDPANIGRVYPVSRDLARAWQGNVHSHVSDLDEVENALERGRWKRLLETYIPVYATGTDRIIAVTEFYQTVDALEREISAAKWRSWLVVGGATLAMYLLLSGLVGRGSNTIVRQRRDLEEKVDRLTALLAENQGLHERVRLAATRTTTLNERFLRRLSAELHDGPAQQIALALLRLDSVGAYCAACTRDDSAGREENSANLDRIQASVRHALQEIRAISSGLRLPELGNLSLSEAVARAVRMHERRTGTTVLLERDELPADVPLPVKITVYRVIEEALNNAYRHGGGIEQRVTLRLDARAPSRDRGSRPRLRWLADRGFRRAPRADRDAGASRELGRGVRHRERGRAGHDRHRPDPAPIARGKP